MLGDKFHLTILGKDLSYLAYKKITMEDIIENNEELLENEELSLDSDKETDNTSNFKRLSKAYKWALAKNKEYEELLNKQWTKQEDWIREKDAPLFNDTDLRFFFLENEEAINYKEEIRDTLNKYPNMDLKDALALAKQLKPKESETHTDLDLVSEVKTWKKSIKDLSEEEALKLPNTEYLEWVNTQKGWNPLWAMKSSIWWD